MPNPSNHRPLCLFLALSSLTLPLTAQKIMVNPLDGLSYVAIGSGSFTMGCSPGDLQCSESEKPAHKVTLTKGFWMGVTPVTQGAYWWVMGTRPSQFKGANLPVESVSWTEAQNYCSRVGMRLPTEAEWEYAARAGTTGATYGPIDAIAWHNKNSGNKTNGVGLKQLNAWGLQDMLGNVRHFVADNYSAIAKALSDYATDPKGPLSGDYRTVRGGSWDGEAQETRVSGRLGSLPDSRSSGVGFRCVGY